jgi:hypothetical protein
MAFSTYAAYISALAAISVTGVTRTYTEPPKQLTTSSLPAQFPRLPTGSQAAQTFSSAVGLSAATAELVIVIEPIMQNTQAVNFALALSLMDAMEAALAAAAASIGIDQWSMEVTREAMADGTVYWLLITTVEASG